jgi:hypothetical protein
MSGGGRWRDRPGHPLAEPAAGVDGLAVPAGRKRARVFAGSPEQGRGAEAAIAADPAVGGVDDGGGAIDRPVGPLGQDELRGRRGAEQEPPAREHGAVEDVGVLDRHLAGADHSLEREAGDVAEQAAAVEPAAAERDDAVVGRDGPDEGVLAPSLSVPGSTPERSRTFWWRPGASMAQTCLRPAAAKR